MGLGVPAKGRDDLQLLLIGDNTSGPARETLLGLAGGLGTAPQSLCVLQQDLHFLNSKVADGSLVQQRLLDGLIGCLDAGCQVREFRSGMLCASVGLRCCKAPQYGLLKPRPSVVACSPSRDKRGVREFAAYGRQFFQVLHGADEVRQRRHDILR
jgi:hypothetical protein